MLEDLAKEATWRYFFGGRKPAAQENEKAIRISPTSNGSNNWVYYVDVGEERYVLRLYNNGRSKTRVRAEHGMLEALYLCGAARTFATPRLKKIREEKKQTSESDDDDLLTYIELSDGSYACFFDFLPGVYVGGKSNFMHSMGKVTSELMALLEHLYTGYGRSCDGDESTDDKSDKSVNAIATLTRYTYKHGPAPYFDLWRVHSAITRDTFFDFCDNSIELKSYSAGMKFLLSSIIDLEKQILQWKQDECEFPMSFVHGDLVSDNFLCDESKEEVTSVIDFEFVGEDCRIMELATCISKFPEEVQPLSNLSLFIGGFRQANLVILQRQEVESLPWMIKTRILSNVIYFVGRAMSGEAELSQLTERIQGYCRRLRWLDDERNKADLISLFD